MSHETVEPKTKNLKEVEEVIARAIKKVGAKRENDICRYIPMTTGGYMHHFTLKKMKNNLEKSRHYVVDNIREING